MISVTFVSSVAAHHVARDATEPGDLRIPCPVLCMFLKPEYNLVGSMQHVL